MKYLAAVFVVLFLLSSTVTFAAKPDTPGNKGKGGDRDFEPIPGSVCIDAGHGGSDIGAVNNDLWEKEVNLRVAFLLQEKLKNNASTVFMTRTDNDTTLSNADRYNFCNSQKAAVLISIHHNGSTNSSTDYTSALYMKKQDVPLAQIVAETVSSKLGLPNHGVSRFASGVLIKSSMPATISEGFFLTNSTEYDLIKNSGRLDQEATALFSAVETYFGN